MEGWSIKLCPPRRCDGSWLQWWSFGVAVGARAGQIKAPLLGPVMLLPLNYAAGRHHA